MESFYFSPEFIAALEYQMRMSLHTRLCIDNPLHAYLCDGSCYEVYRNWGNPEMFIH